MRFEACSVASLSQHEGRIVLPFPYRWPHLQVELPKWGCLNASSSWQDFAERCSDCSIVERVARFAPEAVLGVDWTSFQPYQRLQQGLGSRKAPAPPYVFLNYR